MDENDKRTSKRAYFTHIQARFPLKNAPPDHGSFYSWLAYQPRIAYRATSRKDSTEENNLNVAYAIFKLILSTIKRLHFYSLRIETQPFVVYKIFSVFKLIFIFVF